MLWYFVIYACKLNVNKVTSSIFQFIFVWDVQRKEEEITYTCKRVPVCQTKRTCPVCKTKMENNSRVNLITCIKWVPRGVAKSNPEKVQLTKDELAQIIHETKAKLNVVDDTDNVQAREDDEFNMEQYEAEEGADVNRLGIGGLAELQNDPAENFSDSDDSEKDDDEIKPDDNLILVGKIDDDASIFEIYVYNEKEGSLYVHHDLLLPAFPLCFEWLDYEPGQPKGNYCAVGSMNPVIGVWDLDIMNCLEPAFKLGKTAKPRKGTSAVGHTDAVLALAWNKSFHHVIASGSVDTTILLWDLDEQKPSTTITAFEDKVQCLEWHKLEAQTLLAGGCDKTVKIFDCRSPDAFQTWDIGGEAERLTWNPLQPFTFLVGTNTGVVHCFDCRKGRSWLLQAHEKEVTGLSISRQCPGLLVTSSTDEVLKVWDFNETTEPTLVDSKDIRLGGIHCMELSPDSPFIVTAGGDNKSNNLTVLDLLEMDAVNTSFGSRQLIQLIPDTQENQQEASTST